MNPQSAQPGTGSSRRAALPMGIWALGFVSMFMDISSELVHSLLPVFMGTVLGASMLTIGILEGIAESAAAVTKVFSGALSDYFRKRKLLAVIGYSLSTFTKPIFPLASSVGWVFFARFADRIGKGIRGAPRDALIADLVPKELRGAAYGLRQALDSVGAFLGPVLAVLFMFLLANDIKAVLWIAVIPAMLTVALLVFGVKEPDSVGSSAGVKRLAFSDARRLTSGYWFVVLLGSVFTLARFSEAFLILRAQSLGLGIGYVPLIMIVMNVVYALGAYPAGALADRFPARLLLLLGLVVLVVSDIILALALSPSVAFVGSALWGLHMALTQGLLSKLVADSSPAELRGTAFGVFNLVTGVALLLASVIAGALWSGLGPSAAFVAGAVFAAIAALGLMVYRPDQKI